MEDAAVVVAAAEGGGETGEVRKIRVVYFLTRNGRTEQPHLMRVHHRNRNGSGVRLRGNLLYLFFCFINRYS